MMPWFSIQEGGIEIARLYAESPQALVLNIKPEQRVMPLASAFDAPPTAAPDAAPIPHLT